MVVVRGKRESARAPGFVLAWVKKQASATDSVLRPRRTACRDSPPARRGMAQKRQQHQEHAARGPSKKPVSGLREKKVSASPQKRKPA